MRLERFVTSRMMKYQRKLTPDPLRIFGSSLIRPLASIGPRESATFCSIMPNPSPESIPPSVPREGVFM